MSTHKPLAGSFRYFNGGSRAAVPVFSRCTDIVQVAYTPFSGTLLRAGISWGGQNTGKSK